ncbi:hypothetical protein AK812_SmicGene10863 [Symbiodinium microadriaticum]|uniref:DUF5672 domain-containing protein n=1 Tax=Symbiodinium microadriaticum TaxID=2951 RepID=A0A1Q9EET0_SYMMI|nr:hypothetical protein AK812_SmicGene10863 [Symbiodinium microadriaticum]
MPRMFRNICALTALLAAAGGAAGEHDLDTQCALQLSTKAPLRLAVFMTTHWSDHHKQYLPCWERAVQHLSLLQDADLILYTSGNISSSELARFHFRNITVRKYINPGWQEGAVQAVQDGFGAKGYQEKWFEGYDWVIRLNPDVLIMDDKWLLETMGDASVDGIFGQCMGRQLHTDFFAVRPQAMDHTIVDGCPPTSAEKHFQCAAKSILESNRYAWIKNYKNAVCHIVGVNSPVVHSHALWKCCPDYFAAHESSLCLEALEQGNPH